MDESVELLNKLSQPNFKPSVGFLQHLFKQLRKSKLQRSDIIVKYGLQVIKNTYGDNEVWNLYEQVLIAALDVGDFDLADTCLEKLTQWFKSSSRVARLIGMIHEAKGKYDLAIEIYDKIIEKSPLDVLAMKRKACVYRMQNQYTQVVEELHKILKLFPSDLSTWLELADIHTTLKDYKATAYCYEEAILIDPSSPCAHTCLADAYIQLGGYENLILARKHYCVSLEFLSPSVNPEAVKGLIACCELLLKNHAKEPEPAVNTELIKWVKEKSKTA